MQLSKRLSTAAKMVTAGNRVADIGCDHGYTSIYLLEHKVSEKIIAADINQGPLERAAEHIKKHGLEDKIELRLSNGTEKIISGEVDTLLISGMGGALIVQILENGAAVVSACTELILQPQSEPHIVRKYLRTHGFYIADEEMIVEYNKFYIIMRAVKDTIKGIQDDSDVKDWYGPRLLEKKNKVLYDYLRKQKELQCSFLEKLKDHKSQKAGLRKQQIQQQLQWIKKGLEYYEM